VSRKGERGDNLETLDGGEGGEKVESDCLTELLPKPAARSTQLLRRCPFLLVLWFVPFSVPIPDIMKRCGR